jgi:CRISPR-associated protein Cas5 subtype I-B
MGIIKFEVEGIFNSFRIPFFRTYHKTFLAPPKTTILGMLTNIMGKSEKFYYNILNEDKIKVSVVINSIKGKAKDLWAYKSLENKGGMHGRSIVRRDRLFNARYTIYLKIDETSLEKEVFNSLVYPKAIPSLGLDDELIKISSVKNEIKLVENDTHIINSVFMDKGYEYEVKVKDFHNDIELPTANIVPLKYIITEKKNLRTTRKAVEEYKQVEYINCYVKLKDIESFTYGEDSIVFY